MPFPKAKLAYALLTSAIIASTDLLLTAVPVNAQEMLTLHNTMRQRHCAPAMTWSASLATAAKQWADQCRFQHATGTGQGEITATPPGTPCGGTSLCYDDDTEVLLQAKPLANGRFWGWSADCAEGMTTRAACG